MGTYLSECPHARDYFDRAICPEPCGKMHYRCATCGVVLDGCAHERVNAFQGSERG